MEVQYPNTNTDILFMLSKINQNLSRIADTFEEDHKMIKDLSGAK